MTQTIAQGTISDEDIARQVQERIAERDRLAAESQQIELLAGRFVLPQMISTVLDGIDRIRAMKRSDNTGAITELSRSFRLWFYSRDKNMSLAEMRCRSRGERFSVARGATLSRVSTHAFWIKWKQDGVDVGVQIEHARPASRDSYWRLVALYGFEPVIPRNRAVPGRSPGRRIPGEPDVDAGRYR